ERATGEYCFRSFHSLRSALGCSDRTSRNREGCFLVTSLTGARRFLSGDGAGRLIGGGDENRLAGRDSLQEAPEMVESQAAGRREITFHQVQTPPFLWQ